MELIFLGTGAAIQVPAFHCSCATCEGARARPNQRRTRSCVAICGQEVVLIDAGPDLESQLEREEIRKVNRIFITHWHFDHIAGLPALAVPAAVDGWHPIEVYLPAQVIDHFDQELAYMRERVSLHPVRPGQRHALPDGEWEVVKTTHTDHSVGFIVRANRTFAYLVDGVTPPDETLRRLAGLDLLILEATMDELEPQEDENWMNFSVTEALELWRRVGTPRCILTHLSSHSWKGKRLIAGFHEQKRTSIEARNPGLDFAFDGMRVLV